MVESYKFPALFRVVVGKHFTFLLMWETPTELLTKCLLPFQRQPRNGASEEMALVSAKEQTRIRVLFSELMEHFRKAVRKCVANRSRPESRPLQGNRPGAHHTMCHAGTSPGLGIKGLQGLARGGGDPRKRLVVHVVYGNLALGDDCHAMLPPPPQKNRKNKNRLGRPYPPSFRLLSVRRRSTCFKAPKPKQSVTCTLTTHPHGSWVVLGALTVWRQARML